jgi:hypothetical protein
MPRRRLTLLPVSETDFSTAEHRLGLVVGRANQNTTHERADSVVASPQGDIGRGYGRQTIAWGGLRCC